MTLTPNTRGIIATCLAMVGFIGTDSCIKLASQDLPISQMIALRGIAILAILVAMAFATGAHKALPTFKDKAVGLRAFGECMATLLYYNAIIAIPIANANAVLQTIPLVIVAVAALFFGEKVGWRRWLMILVGFSGVLLIIQPGGDGFMPASLWAVAAVIFFVIRDMATRYRSTPAGGVDQPCHQRVGDGDGLYSSVFPGLGDPDAASPCAPRLVGLFSHHGVSRRHCRDAQR